MTKELFERGYPADSYVKNLRNYRSLVKKWTEEAEADPADVKLLKERAAERPQPVRATVSTEDWCGDSALNLPLLNDLFTKAGIELRVFRGSEIPDLKNIYESEGVDHIPVVSLWDGDGKEIGRWVEAPQAIQPKKEAWKSEHPRFMELYAKRDSDPEAAKEFAKLYREFLETMADWYRNGMWKETSGEICALLA